MKRLLLLFFLVFIILISGCGEQQTIQNKEVNDGIVINDFSFDQSLAYSGEYVSLNLEVQNVGQTTGKLKDISIFGGWLTTPISISDTSDLEPANPRENIQGMSKYFRRRIDNAPNVQTSTNYQFGVRVKYDYTTEYAGTVRFVDPNYLDTLPKQEKDNLIVNNGIITSTVSNGPLNINPISGRSFIVLGSNSVYIKFGITNVGSGYPYVGSEGNYSVKIDDSKTMSTTCYKDEKNTNVKEIKLGKGETGIFICSFSIPSVNNYVDRSFKITFVYSYYTDGSTSITVEPSEVAGSGGGSAPPSDTTTIDCHPLSEADCQTKSDCFVCNDADGVFGMCCNAGEDCNRGAGGICELTTTTSTTITTTMTPTCSDYGGYCDRTTDCTSGGRSCYCSNCLDCTTYPAYCCCI